MSDEGVSTSAAGVVGRRRVWSIGIRRGASPLALRINPKNPVLTASDISDVDALFVADPFMLRRDGSWHMYFEVMLSEEPPRGVVGRASSTDGDSWVYGGIVLSESFHLSYPQIFEWKGHVYLVPETLGAGTVRLYHAVQFPDRFELSSELLKGDWADPTLFRSGGRWWMFACADPYENQTLCLFTADELGGPWVPHPRNPVVARDRSRARPGGRVCRVDGRLIRFAQDCVPRYGNRLRAFEIVELNEHRYREIQCPESPVLTPQSSGWNSVGAHHMDAHELSDGSWIACIDGDTFRYDGETDV